MLGSSGWPGMLQPEQLGFKFKEINLPLPLSPCTLDVFHRVWLFALYFDKHATEMLFSGHFYVGFSLLPVFQVGLFLWVWKISVIKSF